MRVVLMRHSEAARGPWADADRPLTPAGSLLAAAAARGLATLEPHVRCIRTSPAVRANETAAILAAAWPGARVIVDADLAIGGHPEQAAARLLEPGNGAAVLAVGHAPDLSQLASLLLGTRVGVRFDVCGAACISAEPGPGGGAILEWAMGPEVLALLGTA